LAKADSRQFNPTSGVSRFNPRLAPAFVRADIRSRFRPPARTFATGGHAHASPADSFPDFCRRRGNETQTGEADDNRAHSQLPVVLVAALSLSPGAVPLIAGSRRDGRRSRGPVQSGSHPALPPTLVGDDVRRRFPSPWQNRFRFPLPPPSTINFHPSTLLTNCAVGCKQWWNWMKIERTKVS
jgi:hypothetical protein